MEPQFDQSKVKEFEKEYSEVLQALFTKHGLAIVYEPQLRQSKDTGVWGVVVVPMLAKFEPKV